MGSSLKSFIKDVRASKTLAEERSIIQKESAKIRTKLRDDHLPLEKRRKNIQKLLYLFILGEKTHFGQVECINLIASDEFVNKRLGYLAAMLLLDESQDLLTLLTNLLNNDLNHPNKFIVSLALTTLGFLSTLELARDLYPDVENILKTCKDPFLLKQALQCAAKLIAKDVSLLDIFSMEYISSIFENHAICTHSVLLGISKVLQSILLAYPGYLDLLREDGVELNGENHQILNDGIKFIPELLSRLQSLNVKSSQPDYDVKGICDPFLQCEIIYTLRLFFLLDVPEIDRFKNKFEDLLSQIATDTDGSKTSGQAILYETARTIFSLDLEQPLRILGINILAKFLSGRDNNVKYVALNTLLRVVPQEPTAVQRHRKFISRCLHDPDISIRMRALELTFAILDENSLVELVNELVKFLESASGDDKDLIIFTVDNLVETFEKFKVHDEKWKLDIFLKVLELVGSFITLEKLGDILIIINNTEDLQNKIYVVSKMLKVSLSNDQDSVIQIFDDNLGWKLVTIWCIGEYADLILLKNASEIINEESMTKYLLKLDSEYGTYDSKITQYVLTASLKLSSKIDNRKCIEDLRQIILNHTKDPNLMIQVKSVQYELIFSQPREIRKSILASMPIFERKVRTPDMDTQSNVHQKSKPVASNADLLLDLLGDMDSSSGQQQGKAPEMTLSSESTKPENSKPTDLLADIFSSNVNNFNGKAEPVGTSSSLEFKSTVTLPTNATKIYDGKALIVYSGDVTVENGSANFELYFEAKSSVTDLSCQSAVPKSQKLTMGSLYPSASVGHGQLSKQSMKVSGSGKLKLRVKLKYNSEGISNDEQFDHKFNEAL
ncbi:hypothetical protein Kpol_1023p103 [Vanderwaltozyma polyspora DSM 70294]|uniref:AP-1 complex subunit gamma n=1 Tax=Vanderwaltozyma polyspora (strain ATCC 22028 / DSM 70294 / BCRC 21397 / CBS 2163 / NBRC 10782 / NRRL Y-8283 / UCD 57-17) TaxID=436907 RepID=A7TFX1_VANPO|nr:uncharacterized protein Kpol_1023p103 [Vanderwaltozyma polyspora DSM 70294]EDO18929.1 hypothetical protein Kpol_1023p103 [Vanderwaltozyma polyspora DSM 70294]